MNEILEKYISIVRERFDFPWSYIFTLKDLVSFCNKPDENLIAILTTMFIYLNNGSVCVRINDTFYDLMKSLGVENPQWLYEEFKNNTDKYTEIVGSPQEYKPVIFNKEKDLIYFQKYFESEDKVKAIIEDFISVAKNKEYEDGLNQEITDYLINEARNLDELQKVAIFLSVIKNFVLISGGPGTGKTTIIKYLLEFLISRNKYKPADVVISAPTGKASQRIKETIKDNSLLAEVEVLTIHRLLGYTFFRDSFRYNSENKLPYKVLIVDEVSMIDIKLLNHLFEAISNFAKIVLIGDKDQLPSVEAGAFIAKLVPSDYKNRFSSLLKGITREDLIAESGFNDHIVVLEKSFRSEKSLQEFAKLVNAGRTDIEIQMLSQENLNKFFTESDRIFLYEYKDYRNFKNLVFNWLKRQFGDGYFQSIKIFGEILSTELSNCEKYLKEIFNTLNSGKILSTTNIGLYGCRKINELGMEYFLTKVGARYFYVTNGVPVIINENDYNLSLFNGNIGVVLKFKDGMKAVFNIENDYRVYSIDMLPDFSLAFSITVHKSQGSEYERVMLVVGKSEKPAVLNRQILYTAITRAKKGVIIASTLENLKQAISFSIERESGIEYYRLFS